MRAFTVSALLLVSVFASNCFAQAPSASRASDRAANLRDINLHKVSLKLEDASERQALEALFNKVDLNYMYILNPLVEARINLSVENLPFEGALVSILRSVRRDPLEYRPDEMDILAVTPGRASGVTTNLAGRRVWLDFDHVDIRYALKTIFRAAVANYTLDQNVAGMVTVQVKNVPYEEALQRVLSSVTGGKRITMRQEDGVFKVTAGD